MIEWLLLLLRQKEEGTVVLVDEGCEESKYIYYNGLINIYTCTWEHSFTIFLT